MKKFTILVLLLLSTTVVLAQISVNGVVKSSEDDQPLPGVNVVIKGVATGTTTDFDGNYSITVPEGSIIQFSYIGYITYEVTITNEQKELNVALKTASTSLDEVLVIGYATVKKANLTGSVAAVKFSDLESLPSSNATSMLQGRVSGVDIGNFSTQPGNDDPQILIRGMGTFNSGASPLIIVDGMESSLGQIPAGDIESISILKDAASASIYGVRAANGVVLVTTKSGKPGKMVINFNSNFGFQENLIKAKLLGSADFARVRNAWQIADGGDEWYTPEQIQTMENGSNPDLFANTDWMDQAYRTALMQTYHLSVSGGSEKVNYMLSSESFNQEGIMIGTSSERFNLRSNVKVKLNEKLSIGANLFGYKKRIDEPITNAAGTNNEGLNYELRRNTMPTVPAYYSNGHFGFFDGAYDTHGKSSKNILFDTSIGDRYTDLNRQEGKLYLDYDITKELHFTTSYSFISNTIAGSRFKPTTSRYDANGEVVSESTINSLLKANTSNFKYQVENVLTYSKSFDKHNFNFLLGQSAQEFREDYSEAYIENFPNNDIHVLSGGVTNPLVDGYAFENSLSSIFGRINYNFDEKYLFEFNLRRDGSSRMPKSDRYAVFPSVSAGWILSNESFLNENDQISLLKLRGSWGQLGNQEIGEYAYSQSFSTGNNYIIDGSLVGGVAISELANQDISWETTTITDIGLDMNLFNNRVTIVADWFNKTSTDILLRLPIPLTMGADLAPFQNIGEVQNEGWELAVGYRKNFNDFSLFVNANVSQIKNEIIDIGGRESWIDGTFHTINEVGNPIGSFYGLTADGYFSESDFDGDGNLNAGIPSQYGSLKPGDIKYRDISGPDGIPDGNISEDFDREIIGNPFPDITYGITLGGEYKGIDLSAFFQGVQGVDRWQWYNNEADGNYTEAILDFWTPTNTDAAYPSLGNSDNNSKWSSFWVEDASYFRLKNLEIGYTIPKQTTMKAKISRARVYVSGTNLLTFTNVEDYDPERRAQDVRAGSFGQSKVISLGVNLTF